MDEDGGQVLVVPATMRPLDPLLIGSFPAPPTHIPTTPTSPNPPLSRPPSTPLPPVPGPSRISGHESLLLLSASRSRRSSRFSATSESPSPSPTTATHPHSIAFSISEHRHNESLSEIDVRDILAAVPDDDDPLSPTEHALDGLPPLSLRPSFPKHKPKPPPLRRTPQHAHTFSLADPIDPHTIPPSALHRSFTFPLVQHDPDPNARSESPDISTILSTTPRPALRPSRSRPRLSSQRRPSLPSVPTPASRGPASARDSGYASLHIHDAAEDDDDTRSWIDHDEYGNPVPLPRPSPTKAPWPEHDHDLVHARLAKLERALDGEGSDSEASDSSLDLHTPLPHLMVRHGLLSPRSKLIAPPPLNGRDSVASLASTMTTPKDARDTAKRRTRHRDGRLLRGGIGLTTGLGWSDSEDEDAPSALTRRVSALTLARRTSLASLPSLSRSTSQLSLYGSNAHAHPLSRSYSSSTLARQHQDADSTAGVDEWGALTHHGSLGHGSTSTGTSIGKGKGAKTPTRWSSNSLPSASASRTTPYPGGGGTGRGPPTAWSASSASFSMRKSSGSASASARTSIASSASGSGSGSRSSLGGVIMEEEMLRPDGAPGHVHVHGLAPSPSTASTESVHTPTTPPGGDDVDLGFIVRGAGAGAGNGNGSVKGKGIGGTMLRREKSLPPLPPALLRPGALKTPAAGGAAGGRSIAFPGSGAVRSTSTPSSASFSAMKSTPAPGGGAGGHGANNNANNNTSTSNISMLSTPSNPKPRSKMGTPRPLRLLGPSAHGAPSMPPPASPLPSPYASTSLPRSQSFQAHQSTPIPGSATGLLPRSHSLQVHPHQGGDRPAVPVPGVGSYRARSPLPPPSPSPGKPRTGTGMVYRSGGAPPSPLPGGSISRMRPPSGARSGAAGGGGGGKPIAL
ncbi:hypothetical protein H0H81_001052 [Sphagnurus paluster]|uniref:Uncharacterized protein n=1 Tax=Sphagnurus paluster TaxID=117069 RepID=A0A9P7FSS9_9AGAR|nr:hypothetical protein H0H81_001052 [Sphagnurus paluster]